ncbi:MAG: amidohydrolase family protein [Chitinophagales bacterium]
MLLQNLSIIGKDGQMNMQIKAGIIDRIFPSKQTSSNVKDPATLVFEKALAFPGLINSHDHLDFNLFPQLGNRTYRNYREWGKSLHNQFDEEIEKIRRIPMSLRAAFGAYKNLVNGFTTVINHGDFLHVPGAPVRIVQNHHVLHSVGFEKHWLIKLNNPFLRSMPFVIHVGEGTDELASREIDRLIKWNLLKRKLIGVHGVGMSEKQAGAFMALIWCPVSNFFLLGKTANVRLIGRKCRILFGTDSTLTANWNAWDHFRNARETMMASDASIFDMLTSNAVACWGLPDLSSIEPGRKADIVIARLKPGNSTWDSFYSINPEDILLVIQDGQIRLFDQELLEPIRQGAILQDQFSAIEWNHCRKYVEGNLPALMHKIRSICPDIVMPWDPAV